MRSLRTYDPAIKVFRPTSRRLPPGMMDTEPNGTWQDPEGRNGASLWGHRRAIPP